MLIFIFHIIHFQRSVIFLTQMYYKTYRLCLIWNTRVHLSIHYHVWATLYLTTAVCARLCVSPQLLCSLTPALIIRGSRGLASWWSCSTVWHWACTSPVRTSTAPRTAARYCRYGRSLWVCVSVCVAVFVGTTCQCTVEVIEQNDQFPDINSEQLTTLHCHCSSSCDADEHCSFTFSAALSTLWTGNWDLVCFNIVLWSRMWFCVWIPLWRQAPPVEIVVVDDHKCHSRHRLHLQALIK